MPHAEQIRIRPMTEADLAQVMEIEKENFAVPWSEKSFRDMLARPETVFLVAEEIPEEETDVSAPRFLAGYAGALTVWEQGDVTNIAVRDVRKRRGIGALLLESLLAEAAGNGVTEMFLEVREHNEPAKELYRSHGFSPVGIRKGYYTDTREDAIVMKRLLSKK